MDMIDVQTSITDMINTSVKLEDYLFMGIIEAPKIKTIPQSHSLNIKQFSNVIVIDNQDVINMDYIVHIEYKKHDDYGFYIYIYLLRDDSYISFSHISEESIEKIVNTYIEYCVSKSGQKTNSL